MSESNTISPLPQYVNARDICEALSISIPTLYSWMADGKFPKPTKPTLRCARWPAEQVNEWIRTNCVPA